MGIFNTMPEVVVLPDSEDAWAAIALRAEALAHEAGWHDEDSPTELFWLHEHPVPGLGAGVAVGTPDVPAEYKAIHPVPLLEMIRRHMTRPRRDLVGFVVVVEGWMVVGNPDDVAERKYAQALSAERRLRDHPRRIEIRQAHLITLTGQERVVIRRRDGEPIVKSVGREYDGAVPHAMRDLANALRLRKYGRRG